MLVQEFNQQYFQYYTVGIDVEGQLISAIQYVTNPDLPLSIIQLAMRNMRWITF